MKRKISKLIAVMLTLCLVLMNGVQPAEAASNHLLIVNTKKNTLGYYVNRELVKTFKIASGKSSTPTPQGKTTIVNKIKNRPYYSGGIAGGDPKNPLGDRWLGLNIGGSYGSVYGIHGNNNESSIGNHVSGGCIRMHNSEVRWLFDRVSVGTDVIIKYTDQTDEQIAASYKIDLNVKKPGWSKENGKWYYITKDKNYYKNGWLKIDGKNYYFDKDGVMQTGWKKLDNKWYYLESNGVMQTGWKKLDNTWYYLESNGVMQTGWKKIDNNWYYFEDNGTMKTGWKTIDGKWYYFQETGIMRTGWYVIDNNWYYFQDNGDMRTGWYVIDNNWYYFQDNGNMRTGWYTIDGNWYYFYNDGKMATNTNIDGWDIDSNGIGTMN
ncbi:L,D-transpeptidase family protein [Romboutsia lituseburensis]|uniref:Glucan-binding domain-containing protein (YG repeat) n=1 Tax=Romboutsia lituseburensis DSM 797 TaxID=1121325 RepID=A0A1G9QQL4_9FIRM|nr:L,D-transpeptidase family protein [Romboutsia lituseburensis]CEH35632.1 Cell surface protein [Romboutsia lituseburensis]SDM13263.1 Glucan-binding domain-containing protein (YG repeat) [Romboutsia lituseburensis DSM 797]